MQTVRLEVQGARATVTLSRPEALNAITPGMLAELRAAFESMRHRLGSTAGGFVVQAMAPTGVATRLATVEDPLFGPVVSFGLGGVATDLLGDRSYGVPPLTDSDLASLVRGVRAAPLLLGHGGSTPVDVAALEDLLARLARLADDVPEVADLERRVMDLEAALEGAGP